MIDPVTGLWSGAWPPDPSWDQDPLLASPPILPSPEQAPAPAATPGEPVVTPAPEAQQAAAAADALFTDAPPAPEAPAVSLSQPKPVDAPKLDPVDENLIEMDGEPAAPPELAAPAPALLTNPKNREQAAKEAERDKYAQMSDEQLALSEFQSQQAAEAEAQTARLRAAQQDREDAIALEGVHRKAMERAAARQAEIDAEATRLANEKVDPEGWKHSGGLFRTIGSIALGVIGGLVQSRQGLAQNPGLQMINQAIERHIDAQKANIANRRAALGERRTALASDREQEQLDMATEQAFRQAAYQRAIDEAEEAKQQFDPQGSRYRQTEMFQRQLQAQQMKARQEQQDAFLKQQIELGKYNLEAQKAQSVIDLNAAKAAKLKGGGGSGGASASKLKKTATQWNQEYGGNIPDDGTPLTLADYNARVNAKKSVKALNEPSQAETQARNLAVTGPKGVLLQEGSTPEKPIYYNPPDDAAPKTRQLIYTTGQIVADLDRALYLRDKVGGELGQLNSDERQEYDQIEQRVTLMAKGQHEGMSSDSDLKRLGTSLGVENLASFRSKAHGLKTAREAVVRQMNGWLNANNYTGEPVTWPNTQTKATKLTAKQRAAQELVTSEAGADQSHVPTIVAATGPGGYAAKTVDWGYGKLAGKKAATPEQQKKMRAFIKLATQKGDEASVQALKDIAEGESPEFRAQAQAALMVVDFLHRTPDEEVSAKDREDDEAFIKEGE